MIGTLDTFERMSVPVCAVDAYHRIVVWNRAAEDLFCLAAEGAMGREWHTVIQTWDTPGCCALCRAWHALRQGESTEPIEVIASVEGYHQRVTMVPVPLGSGVDQTISFLMLQGEARQADSGELKPPIPISTRVRRLDDERMVENLTMRERQVLACIVEGLDARRIAETVGITHATARNYVQRILMKLGARNKAEAVTLALRYNLLAS